MGKANRVRRDLARSTKREPRPGDEDFQPVIIEKKERPEAEPIHLFSIGDQKYYMPAFIPASVALCMLEVEAEAGESASITYVLSEVLGEEGYTALLNCKDLESADMEKIVRIIVRTVMGTLEAPAGN